MKTNILLLFLSFFLIISSCNLFFKISPPTIEITNNVPDSGWFLDTLTYELLLKSEEPPIRLQISPSEWSGYGDNIIDSTFEANEVNFKYTYILDFAEYLTLNIKFKITQNDLQKDSIIRYVTFYTLGT